MNDNGWRSKCGSREPGFLSSDDDADPGTNDASTTSWKSIELSQGSFGQGFHWDFVQICRGQREFQFSASPRCTCLPSRQHSAEVALGAFTTDSSAMLTQLRLVGLGDLDLDSGDLSGVGQVCRTYTKAEPSNCGVGAHMNSM